ncbi:MAG: helix-turn-helix transcriptional regulator [Armatimonadota bacterium]|nr:helix-turn-helix transcriptional regulator [Armatimonadota bacterium]
MKLEQKQEARRLRCEQGLALNEIAALLQVSKSSVSLWVRDVVLSDEHLARLNARNPLYNRQLHSGHVNRERSRNRRLQYQEAGRRQAREGNLLHMAGCMLYWAEGTKQRNVLVFTNSDPDMVAFFLNFLRRCYSVADEEVTVTINCFDDCHSVKDIEEFWLQTLNVPGTCLRKATVNVHSCYSQKKRCGKLVYGTCRLAVCRTAIVQSIYGAIQEYGGFTIDKWAD